MKNKSIVSLIALLLGLSITTTSCEDMLTPEMERYAQDFNGKDTVYYYLGILRSLQNAAEQNAILGDVRSDLAATTAYSSDSLTDLLNFKSNLQDGDNALLNRAVFYKVINECNFYLSRVDSNVVKNSVYYMRKETAQVQLIRAWTYMQLVLNYGRVPYITKPVADMNTGWETNPEAWATADNLLDLLKKDVEQASSYQNLYGSPNYSADDFSHADMRFYADLVMGDLYLLRGSSKSDYEQAAYYYHEYLDKGRHTRMAFSPESYMNGGHSGVSAIYAYRSSLNNNRYLYSSGNWMNHVQDPSLTSAISAATSTEGQWLTRRAGLYGYSFESRAGDIILDEDGNVTGSTGSTSVTIEPKIRQIGPSAKYEALAKAQVYTLPKFASGNSTELLSVENLTCGDVRYMFTAAEYEDRMEGVKAPFITKVIKPSMNTGSYVGLVFASFSRMIPIYRVEMVLLRYAEALNRAGFPRHAFAILRDGFNTSSNYRTLPEGYHVDTIYDDNNSRKIAYGVVDSVGRYNAADYVGPDELFRAQGKKFLDFTESTTPWMFSGIHELGCGESSVLNEDFSYDKVVAQRILDEAARTGNNVAEARKHARRLLADEEEGEGEGEEGGEDVPEIDRSNYEIKHWEPQLEANELEMDAVESLIADEMALEMAFEGTRFHDLVRIARHKEKALGTGYSWLAWSIARRNLKLAPYEQPQMVDQQLYNYLLDPENWYAPNPKY